MSPLVTGPVRGYADWQRIENYDSEPLWNVDYVNTTSQETSPVLDVSRFGYLGGVIDTTQNASATEINWYLDSAASDFVGQRIFTTVSNIDNEAQLRIVNLGSFVQFLTSGIGGGPYTTSYNIFSTNRVHPLEFIPSTQVLISAQNVAIGGSAQLDMYPSVYYSGPIAVWLLPIGETMTLTLQYLDEFLTWNDLNQVGAVAGVNVSPIWVAPAGAWRMVVSNNSAVATTFYMAVTPSMTGAS